MSIWSFFSPFFFFISQGSKQNNVNLKYSWEGRKRDRPSLFLDQKAASRYTEQKEAPIVHRLHRYVKEPACCSNITDINVYVFDKSIVCYCKVICLPAAFQEICEYVWMACTQRWNLELLPHQAEEHEGEFRFVWEADSSVASSCLHGISSSWQYCARNFPLGRKVFIGQVLLWRMYKGK